MIIKQLFGIKKLLYAGLFVGNIIMAAQYPVGGLFGANHDARFITNKRFFKAPLTQYTNSSAYWSCDNGLFNRGIEFFKDEAGSKFVLKHQLRKQDSIHDILGCRIGQVLGDYLVNAVIPAPISISSQLKFSYGEATLHTHAPGIEVDNIPELSEAINIKKGLGLADRNNLKSITIHKDIAKIMALNLYLDDRDCHGYNLFYDWDTDHFCAIDKGLVFRTMHYWFKSDYHGHKLDNILPHDLLATKACDFLETIKKDNLSAKEIDSLKQVSTTLKSLMAEYPSMRIHSEWMDIAQDLKFEYPEESKEDISILVDYNHHENKRLVRLIDKLIS